MNESKSAAPSKSRFPRKAVIWTVFALVVVLLLHWQIEFLNLRFGLDPAIPWLAMLALTFMTLFVWAFWAFFFKRDWTIGLIIVAVPTVFLTLYYPDFGGDANLQTFRPRFWSWRTAEFAETELGSTSKINSIESTPYDFPQFLGRGRDLRVENVELSDDWSGGFEELWRTDVGNGWSGFSVVNGLAVTQEQREGNECTTCYDILSGKLLWIYREARRHEDPMAMGKVGPRATPTIDGNYVYTTSGTGVLDCLNLRTGALVWTANIPNLVSVKQLGNTNSRGLKYTLENSALAWGRSCSPVIYENKIIVPAGGPKDLSQFDEDPTATMIAFDKLTGKEIWRGGKRMISYGSPNIATINGTKFVTLVTQDHAVGHDVESGEELWAHQRDGSSDGDANCSQVTNYREGMFLLSKGYGTGGELISVQQDDDKGWSVASIKKNPRVLRTKFTNPLIVDDHAFALTDGFLECVSLKDGNLKRKWRQRGRYGNGQILAVGDKILVHTESGELMLISADPEKYTELGKRKTVSGFCWNTICLYGDLVLVRSDLEAACYRLPIQGNAIAETSSVLAKKPSQGVPTPGLTGESAKGEK